MAQEEEEVVFDIEADGLTPTKVHCWSASDGRRGTTAVSFRESLDASGNTLVAHNGIGYDSPVLDRLWDICIPRESLVDTLVLSRLAVPDRTSHSLEAWGETLGVPKVIHEDWDTYSPEMQHRCDQDVLLTEKVLSAVRVELEGFSNESIDLEHSVAWIIQGQMDAGWQFDERKGFLLAARLRDRQRSLEKEVQEVFRPLVVQGKAVLRRTKDDGGLSKVGLNCLGDDWEDCGGDFTRITFPEFNLGSRQQIGRYLKWFGWEPTKFTETGQAQVDESTLKYVTIPEAKLILEYITVGKVSAMVESWIEAQKEDGRIYGYVNSNGAVTGRMTHSKPNLGQVPRRSALGKECRELFVAKPGYVLVGMDASGLELRMLAHYMKDPAYIKAVVEGTEELGTDVHTLNQRAAGLKDRDTAKTFIYAFLYGAGGLKISTIAGLKGRRAGDKLKALFLEKTPALRKLIGDVKRASKRGYLMGLDGRRLRVRSQHAALNTLLQGAGAVVMKKALVLLNQSATEESSLDFSFVGNIHDEIQAEVLLSDAEVYGRLAEEAMVAAGEHFGLRCPLAGVSKAGAHWGLTH